MGSAIDRLSVGMEICPAARGGETSASWAEQVIPYGFAERMLITPSGWSLTEETREVRLPRG